MRAHLFVPAAVAAIVLAMSSARAETGAVVVYGTVKPEQREVVASAAVQALRAASWAISEAALSQKEQAAIVACSALDRPWPCVSPMARKNGLDRIVVVDVEPGDPRDLVLTGQILVAGDAVPSSDRAWCFSCGDSRLLNATSDLVELMLQHVTARNPRATLFIHTIPAGAVITLDGKMVGVSDQSLTVAPGAHAVLLQRSGYKTASQSVSVADGQSARVDVTLERGDSGSAEPRRRWLVPGLLVGVGTLALVGGAYVSFTAEDPKTGPQHEYAYSGPGIAVAIAGGAFIATGVYLWVRGKRRASAPTAFATQDGAVVGWIGRF